MIIFEIFDELSDPGRRKETDDNTTLSMHDLRKTKLTLAQINRLRVMNDVRALEYTQKLVDVKGQYAPAASEEGANMSM